MEITKYHHLTSKTLANGQKGFVVDHGTRMDQTYPSNFNIESRVDTVLVQRDSFVGNTNESHGFYISQDPKTVADHDRSLYGLWEDRNGDTKVDVFEVETFESIVGGTKSDKEVVYTTLDVDLHRTKDQVLLSEKIGVLPNPKAGKSQVSFTAPKSWWERVFSR